MGILQLQPSLQRLDETKGVARAALNLVPHGACEVKFVDVSEIVRLWHHLIWDLFNVFVLLLPTLGFDHGIFEFLRFVAECLFARETVFLVLSRLV